MKRSLLISVAALGLAVASDAVLAADNAMSFNGSYCSNYYGSQATSFNHQYNGIANITANSLYVSCPIVEDEVTNTLGTNSVWVYYTGAGTVSCSLFSMNGVGTIRQSQVANRVGTGWFQIPNLTTDDYWGTHSMYCLVPANGVLNTIHVVEKP